MDEVLKDLYFSFAYLENIPVLAVPRRARPSHPNPLHIQSYGILVTPYKGVFRVPEIQSWDTNSHLLVPSPSRDESQIFKPGRLMKVVQFRRFLGMLDFCLRFLPHAASIQTHLHNVLSGPNFKSSRPVSWTYGLYAAFDE
jgi:hypothetical protein